MPPPEPPLALIEHELPGRLRLRVPSCRGDRAYFRRVEARLREAPFLQTVRGNAATGSLLLCYAAAPGEVAAFARENGLFDLRTEAPRRPPRHLTGATADPPAVSPRLLVAAGLAGLGVAQIARGRMAGPATESFWHAHRARTELGRPWMSAMLAALGLYRVATGPILGSAVSLLFYAISAMEQRRPNRNNRADDAGQNKDPVRGNGRRSA